MMKLSTFRVFGLGALIGVSASVSTSCSPPPAQCSATTCANGCCANGQCVGGTAPTACGARGNMCVSCPTGFSCTSGSCTPTNSGGGFVTAGGSAAGGSAAGGAAAGGAAAGGTAGGSGGDTTPPTILSTTPPAGATGVNGGTGDAGITITIDFSEPIDTASFSATLSPPVPLLGSPSFSNGNASASVTTAVSLNSSATYTVSVAARDLANNALAPPTMFGFTTAAVLDTTPPTVTSTVPANNATNVAVTGLTVSATFSEAVAPASVVGTISGPLDLGTATMSAGNTIATWSMPQFDDGGVGSYAPSTLYNLTIEASDTAGNAMVMPHAFSFTTASPPDTTPPTLVGILPNDLATGVPTNSSIVLTFSEPMNTASVTTNLRVNGSARPGTFTWNATNSTVRFSPSTNWLGNTAYTVSFFAPPTDVAGNALGSVSRSFTTSAGVDTTAALVSNRNPAVNATGVPTRTGCALFRTNVGVSLTYNSAIDPVSFATAFRVNQAGTPVAGTLSFSSSGTVVTFTPAVPFAFDTTYQVQVNDSSNVARDLQLNPIMSENYSFRTMRELSRVIYNDPAQSGRILSAAVSGQSTVALNVAVRVGEFTATTRSRGLVSFNLGAIPSNVYCVNSATFMLEQSGVNGTPYGSSSLGDVILEAVNMGGTLEGADYNTPAISGGFFERNAVTLSTDPVLGFKTAQAPGQIRLALAQGTPANVRWRLRFSNDGANMGAIDNASFQNTAFNGRVVVRFEAP